MSSTWGSCLDSSMMSYTSSNVAPCSERPFHSTTSSPERDNTTTLTRETMHSAGNIRWCRTHFETICVRKGGGGGRTHPEKLFSKNVWEFSGEKKLAEWTISRNMTKQKVQEDLAEKQERRWESGIKWQPWDSNQGRDIRPPRPPFRGDCGRPLQQRHPVVWLVHHRPLAALSTQLEKMSFTHQDGGVLQCLQCCLSSL